jgi:hypothetical protein
MTSKRVTMRIKAEQRSAMVMHRRSISMPGISTQGEDRRMNLNEKQAYAYNITYPPYRAKDVPFYVITSASKLNKLRPL